MVVFRAREGTEVRHRAALVSESLSVLTHPHQTACRRILPTACTNLLAVASCEAAAPSATFLFFLLFDTNVHHFLSPEDLTSMPEKSQRLLVMFCVQTKGDSVIFLPIHPAS